jgi:hypothetical protein
VNCRYSIDFGSRFSRQVLVSPIGLRRIDGRGSTSFREVCGTLPEARAAVVVEGWLVSMRSTLLGETIVVDATVGWLVTHGLRSEKVLSSPKPIRHALAVRTCAAVGRLAACPGLLCGSHLRLCNCCLAASEHVRPPDSFSSCPDGCLLFPVLPTPWPYTVKRQTKSFQMPSAFITELVRKLL